MSSGRSGRMRKCSPSVRSYDSPRVTRMLRSPCALISAPSASPTLPLSAKISQLPRLAGVDGSRGWLFIRTLPELPLEFVEPVVQILLAARFISRPRLSKRSPRISTATLPGLIQEPHVSLDGIGVPFLQLGVTP